MKEILYTWRNEIKELTVSTAIIWYGR